MDKNYEQNKRKTRFFFLLFFPGTKKHFFQDLIFEPIFVDFGIISKNICFHFGFFVEKDTNNERKIITRKSFVTNKKKKRYNFFLKRCFVCQVEKIT